MDDGGAFGLEKQLDLRPQTRWEAVHPVVEERKNHAADDLRLFPKREDKSAWWCVDLHPSLFRRGSYRGNSVLDVILTDSGVYVMDILYFNNVDYGESEAESRLFTLHSRVVFNVCFYS